MVRFGLGTLGKMGKLDLVILIRESSCLEFPAISLPPKFRNGRCRDGGQVDDKATKHPLSPFDPSGPQIQ